MKNAQKFTKYLILLIVLTISIGAVSATDNITDDAYDDSSISYNINGYNPSYGQSYNNLSESSDLDNSGNILSSDIVDDSKVNNIGSGNIYYVGKNTTKYGSGTADDPFNNLKLAINSSSSGDSIIINNGTYTGINNSGLTIGKSLNILAANNANPIFSGSNARQIFDITGNNVLIQGLILQSGKSAFGGAVYIEGDNVTLNNCTIKNNYGFYGGAIYIDPYNNDAKINNCIFYSNYAYYQSTWANGGAICNNGINTVITNCNFTSNRAGYGGAIASYKPNMSLVNCSFTSNVAAGYGGAFLAFNKAENSTIDGCNFTKNYCDNFGGAVEFESNGNIIINSNFKDNWSPQNGGALMIRRSNNTIINSTFDSNFSGRGGAICYHLINNVLNENNTIINSTFKNNGGNSTKGGAIFSYANNTNISACTFENNFALSGGAILLLNSVLNTIEDSTFINNLAIRNGGGAISSSNYDDKIINSTFINNTAKNYGGALSINNANVFDSTFTDNKAKTGAAIYAINASVNGSKFSNNVADDGEIISALNKVNVSDSDIEDSYIVSHNQNTVITGNYTPNMTFMDNGYMGYCAENYTDEATNGILWDNLTILRNSLNDENVAEYIKALIYEYYVDDTVENSLQRQINIFTDEDFRSSDDEKVKHIINLVDGGFTVDTDNAVKTLVNGSIVVYKFAAVITPKATQNLIVFKLFEGANATVTKDTVTPTVIKGSNVTFNVTVTNTGDCNLTNILINDTDFSDGLNYLSFVSGSDEYIWIYNESKGIWSLNNTLEPGDSANILLIFNTNGSGVLVNNVTIGIGNYTFCNDTSNVTVLVPNMTVRKICDNQIVKVGEYVKFTIVVSNTGDCNLTGVYLIDNTYTQGLVYSSFNDKTGKWNYLGNGKWVYNGSLGVGESTNLTIIFKAITEGVKLNTVIAGSNETNETVISTNTTNVTKAKDNNTKNDTINNSKVHYRSETKIMSTSVGLATGNPLFVLLIALFACILSLKRKK